MIGLGQLSHVDKSIGAKSQQCLYARIQRRRKTNTCCATSRHRKYDAKRHATDFKCQTRTFKCHVTTKTTGRQHVDHTSVFWQASRGTQKQTNGNTWRTNSYGAPKQDHGEPTHGAPRQITSPITKTIGHQNVDHAHKCLLATITWHKQTNGNTWRANPRRTKTTFAHALTCCSPRPQHGTQAAARVLLSPPHTQPKKHDVRAHSTNARALATNHKTAMKRA